MTPPRIVQHMNDAVPGFVSPIQLPVRVLHVITRMIIGGAQENTLLSVEGLDDDPAYEVVLASGIDNGPEGDLLARARQTTELVMVPGLCRNVSPLADLRALWNLYRLIRRGRFHIVHTHSSKAGVLGRIAARLAGTPIVVHTLHGPVFHDYQPWIVNRLWRFVERCCAPLTDHFISVCDVIRNKAVNARISRDEKYSTIYSGMELNRFLHADVDGSAIRCEFGIPSDAPVIGKIARLFPLKGHDQLLDAAPRIVERHPDVRFLLVGDGVLLDHLKNRVRELKIEENVVFAGLIDRERIPEMISAMDVLIHTSLREGLARVLPQALAMRKPCVSFDVDGAPEVVISGETGELVAPEDSVGLADAVSRLLADPELRAEMGAAGRRLVAPKFDAETMVRQIADLYQALLTRHADRILRFDGKQRHQPQEPTPSAEAGW